MADSNETSAMATALQSMGAVFFFILAFAVTLAPFSLVAFFSAWFHTAATSKTNHSENPKRLPSADCFIGIFLKLTSTHVVCSLFLTLYRALCEDWTSPVYMTVVYSAGFILAVIAGVAVVVVIGLSIFALAARSGLVKGSATVLATTDSPPTYSAVQAQDHELEEGAGHDIEQDQVESPSNERKLSP